ncbi:Wzz/FepE/Etk N-terminal domain-containing protein [Roseateles sp. L2-2]|uniref:Wzz/FepE/Etk N-terminal domain-containing protein n=1 Tax=Roseateles sp. L2-2 TaxID=3422597 RepID=UPI003D35BBEC
MQAEQQPAPGVVSTGSTVTDDADVLSQLWPHWRRIALTTVASGVVAYGLSFLVPLTFTAKAVIVSPQQQQNSAANALSSVGALAGLAGLSGRTPADQYVSLMQSVTISNKIIDRFDLLTVYGEKFRVDAQRKLADSTRIAAGKKDNLISIEVDDHDPKRAADIANAFVEELRQLSNGLALSEAQVRRQFFEQHLAGSRDALKTAQAALQKSGIGAGALKSEPKAAAESYARLKAEVAAAEIRLTVLRRTLADNAPEISQQNAMLGGLRGQLAKLEQPLDASGDQDYIGAYRDYKYQETLFEIFARQYELARLDESREGTLIQVLDTATTPERKSKPKRSTLAIAGAGLGFLAAAAFLLFRHRRRTAVR